MATFAGRRGAGAWDLGMDFKLRVWVGSKAAKVIVSRIGLGKVRHMAVKFLWAQEASVSLRLMAPATPLIS